MDYGDFSASMHRLGRTFSKPVDAELIEDYFEDLKGYSLPIVEQALTHCRQTARFWPRPVQVLDACIERARERSVSSVPDGHAPCRDCADSGFERGPEGRGLWCDGSGVCHLPGCGTPGADSEGHWFTRRCPCRTHNPVLARERDASKRQSPGVAA
jgi:hypothetical protein